ncbi:hypothetical protein PAPYR_5157 [Paratrimastix pyriformis]|uniref:non-specific serine/threonine protein kinase n=1 Tax=Paratrimastix pyriformis TaxID=342808 RepID=A0ABQ8UI32_9EUKA|nr:hypothetical protein PAPYR_5157 [Paratrimastix pyriformis]
MGNNESKGRQHKNCEDPPSVNSILEAHQLSPFFAGCGVTPTDLDLVDHPTIVFVGPFAPAAQIVFELARSILANIKRTAEGKELFGVLGSQAVQLQHVIGELMGRPEMEPLPAVEGALTALMDTLNTVKTLTEHLQDSPSGVYSFLHEHRTALLQAETDIRRHMEVIQYVLIADCNDTRSEMRLVLKALSTIPPPAPVDLAPDAGRFLDANFPTSTRIAIPAFIAALRDTYPGRWRPECEQLLGTLVDIHGNGFLDMTDFPRFAKPTLMEALTGFFDSPEARAVPAMAPSGRPAAVDAAAVDSFRSRFLAMDMTKGGSLIAQARALVTPTSMASSFSTPPLPPPTPILPRPNLHAVPTAALPTLPPAPPTRVPEIPPSCSHVPDTLRDVPFTSLPTGLCGGSYLCHDKERASLVVVKVFRPPVGPDLARRLIAEQTEFFNRLAHIHHPHLLTAAKRCYRQAPDRVYMVTPYCPAGNLDAFIAGRPSRQQMWAVLWEQTHALNFLHGTPLVDGTGRGTRNPIVHRNIKPTNILFGADGVSTLGGLEMARELVPGSGQDQILMTPGFDAPELPQTGNTLASDVYALGASLFCLFSRTPSTLVHGPPTVERFLEVLRECCLPREVRSAVARMCCRDPARRPTMAQLREILIASSAPAPVEPTPLLSTPSGPSPTPGRAKAGSFVDDTHTHTPSLGSIVRTIEDAMSIMGLGGSTTPMACPPATTETVSCRAAGADFLGMLRACYPDVPLAALTEKPTLCAQLLRLQFKCSHQPPAGADPDQLKIRLEWHCTRGHQDTAMVFPPPGELSSAPYWPRVAGNPTTRLWDIPQGAPALCFQCFIEGISPEEHRVMPTLRCGDCGGYMDATLPENTILAIPSDQPHPEAVAPAPLRSAPEGPELSMLVASANPDGTDPLTNCLAELEKVFSRVCRYRKLNLRVHLLSQATKAALQDAIKTCRPSAFVLVSHGKWEGQILHDQYAGCTELTAPELLSYLEHAGCLPGLQAAALCACYTGKTGLALREHGVARVVATRDRMLEWEGAKFLSVFVFGLAEAGLVDDGSFERIAQAARQVAHDHLDNDKPAHVCPLLISAPEWDSFTAEQHRTTSPPPPAPGDHPKSSTKFLDIPPTSVNPAFRLTRSSI